MDFNWPPTRSGHLPPVVDFCARSYRSSTTADGPGEFWSQFSSVQWTLSADL